MSSPELKGYDEAEVDVHSRDKVVAEAEESWYTICESDATAMAGLTPSLAASGM